MTAPQRDRALVLGAGALLLVSALAHLYFVLGGEETFWVVVTVAMAAFCFVSSIHLLGTRDALTFLGIGVAFGLFFEVGSPGTELEFAL